MDAFAPDRSDAVHLIVCQHGLHGSDTDFLNFQHLFSTYLQQHASSEPLYIHSAACNAQGFFQTYDGIDTGGQRLADEILELVAHMPQLRKFSMIGHSLGGLYNRYCLGILHARGFFDRIEPMNFITLATPHLGIRRPQRGSFNLLYNTVASRLFDRTGQQFTLKDDASDLTKALAQRTSGKSKENYTGLAEMQGTLPILIHSEATNNQPDPTFEDRHCVLQDRTLRVLSSEMNDQVDQLPVFEWDLKDCHVQVVLLPDNDSSSGSVPMKLEIRPNDQQSMPIGVILFQPEELAQQWKWIVALSNSCFGIECRTDGSNSSSSSESTPLLECLAGGQFLQALLLFKSRSLYANIFFDLQVPFSCASIRAFNPYRLDPHKCQVSSVYVHLTINSLWHAPLLRETMPVDAKTKAHAKATERQRRDMHKSRSLPTQSSRRRSKSSADQPETVDSKRNAPFVDGLLLLDRFDEAFTTDPGQDVLRGMLISLQSVGWRRFDVLFENVLAHERIIAKRANPAKLMDSGLDVVHHVMDTFLL